MTISTNSDCFSRPFSGIIFYMVLGQVGLHSTTWTFTPYQSEPVPGLLLRGASDLSWTIGISLYL